MAIIIQGGGGYPDTKIMDKLFFDKLKNQKSVLYIPNAMVGGYSFDDCYSYISDIASNLGVTQKIEMITNLELLPEILEDNYSGIYIGGGNTFKLLDDIKKSAFFKKLNKFIKSGGIVCGGSAGAIILGKNIYTSPDANIVMLRNCNGLNVFNSCSIWCHYKEEDREQIKMYVKRNRIPILVLKETSGIIKEKNISKVIGIDSVYLFTDSGKIKEYKSGEELEY